MLKKLKSVWKWWYLLLIILFLGILFGWLLGTSKQQYQEIRYREFYQMAENGEVVWADISGEFVIFKGKDSDIIYQTDHPFYDGFREFLLLHDVEVEMKTSAAEWLYLILDALFYLFFFGLLGFAVYKLCKNKTFRVVKHIDTKFSDVIGMEELKEEFYQIMNVMKDVEKYQKQGIRMPKGILLEGAPGNGKTLFARAAAGESLVSFIPAKATDFESMFMAVGPMKVKQLFQLARKHTPCIIFIDEFDGIGTRRSYQHTAIETENARIVTALLNEMDGFTANEGILVIAATNNRRALDEALVRPGRFDRKYVVPYPDKKARISLIEMYTRNKILEEGINIEDIADLFENCSCAKIETILNQAALAAERRGSKTIGRVEIMIAIAEVNN